MSNPRDTTKVTSGTRPKRTPGEQALIDHLESLYGSMTEEAKNLAIAQAEAVGDLWNYEEQAKSKAPSQG